MSTLKQAIEDAGGAAAVATSCGVSVRAVYKWAASGVLPRTEYTGETNYADCIAGLSLARGKEINPSELRRSAAPRRSAA
ncbi:YdaS family helix-turn-helix protein [Pseudomonas sp. NBRC 100443]|uniref:YdaS family helix-turn-helix protein n=1 Tax=Pseudomonas sp. NBRC 100443 TaxID=1113665 RepID=UPI00249FD632|nr:YdaS family helix-turn-helix protein [Pseudomonas sp. NBRC 100443]GLU37147.1 hypothetical protein Pssp01_12400 [Pseudomonas sp. NBRC 100443]